MTEGLLDFLTIPFMIVGAFVAVGSLVSWSSELSRTGYSSFMKPLLGIAVGGMIASFTFIIPWILDAFTTIYLASGEPAPTRAPSTPEAAPVPEPATTPEPFVLPEIQNSGTIWLFVVIAGVLALSVFTALSVFRATAGSRAQRRENKALASEFSERWAAVQELHQKLLRKITHAETDWDTLFFKPALSDITVPSTRLLYEAMRAAGDASSELPRVPVEDLSSLAYPKAVYAFRNAWDVAEREATKIGQRGLTREERRTINEIQKLLAVAENSGSSPTEREIAYRRVKTLAETLHNITLPTAALEALESGLAKTRAIEASTGGAIAL